MHLRRSVLILCILGGMLTSIHAQENKPSNSYTLGQAQDYAVQSSYNTRLAQMEVEKAEKQVGETRAMGLPQINASVEYTNFLNLATQLLPAEMFGGKSGEFIEVRFGTQHNLNAGITASQLIFSGSYIVALRASAAYKQMSVIQQQRTEAQVRHAVRQSYVAVLVSQQSVSVLDSIYLATEKNFAQLKAMTNTGFLDQTEADQIELLLSNLDNQRLLAQNQHNIAQNMLKYNMGIPLTETVVLSNTLDDVLTEFDMESYLAAEISIENNIDYQVVRNQLRISELALSLEKSNVLPTLSAFLTQRYTANRNELDFASSDGKWFPTSLLGITLNIPIFAGGERHYRIQKAKVEKEKAELQLQQTGEGLRLEFESAKSAYSNSYRVYTNTRKDKDLARRIYERTLVKYNNGLATSLELQQNHNQYLQKESAYLMALQSFMDAKSQLDKALAKFEKQ